VFTRCDPCNRAISAQSPTIFISTRLRRRPSNSP
jgi:hypothetical protein